MNPDLQERIYTLWDELTEIDATRFNAVTDRLMVHLCELVEAQNAVWIGSVRLSDDVLGDPVKGWRTPVVRQLYQTWQMAYSAREQAQDLYRGRGGRGHDCRRRQRRSFSRQPLARPDARRMVRV